MLATPTRPHGVRAVVRRRPLLTFAVLVLALSWPMLRLTIDVPVLAIVTWVLGPATCAFVVTWLADGPDGVRALAGRVRRWRVPARWYLFVLFGMAAGYWAAAYALTALLFPAALVPPNANQLVVLGLNFVLLFFGVGLIEEFGWRGFALPRMEQSMTPLRASLVVGLLWWAWHLPRDLPTLDGTPNQTLIFGLFFVVVLADAVIYTWVFHRTGGSVLMVALLHATSNSWGGYLYSATFTADPPGFTAYFAVRVGIYVLAAVTIVVLTRGRLGQADPADRQVDLKG